MVRCIVIWVVGLLTLLPYSLYYLLFEWTRDHVPVIPIIAGFWLFCYWGVVGPILTIIKIRTTYLALLSIESKADLLKLIASNDSIDDLMKMLALSTGVDKSKLKTLANRLISVDSHDQFTKLIMESSDSKEAIIGLISKSNRIPKFIVQLAMEQQLKHDANQISHVKP